METKLCPYCKEEIKIDAVKCKHCGEFLDKRENTKEVITVEPGDYDYQKGVYACIATIVYSIAEVFYPDLGYTKVGVFNVIMLLIIGLYMIRYINSYKKKGLTIPMILYFVIIVGFSTLALVMGKNDDDTTHIGVLGEVIVFLIFLMIIRYFT